MDGMFIVIWSSFSGGNYFNGRQAHKQITPEYSKFSINILIRIR